MTWRAVWAWHWRAGQVVDEVPMLYSSAIFLWIAASLHYPVAGPRHPGTALLAFYVPRSYTLPGGPCPGRDRQRL
jgi:hypothetical protein